MAETESAYTLNKVRTLKNYGLYITGSTVDPIYTKGIINSKPNILINGSTCTIDYSHVYDVSDSLYLKRTFGGFSGAGETFSIAASEYFDEYNNVNTTLSGTCRLSTTINDNHIIIATIVSGLTATSDYNYYGKDNFIDTPQYTFTSTGGTIGYFLVNSLPNLSKITFNSMGILGSAYGFEEYIEISGGTLDNAERILISGTTQLKDSTELLYFAAGGTFQNFSTTNTSVDLYLRGYPSLMTYPQQSNITGIYTISDALTNDLINCYENQTINQAQLRNSKIAVGYLSSFINCTSCYDLIYGSGISTPFSIISPAFNNLIYITISSPVSTTNIAALNINITTSASSIILAPSNGNTTLKIDLSHPSILGYSLETYTDAAREIPLGYAYKSYGVPGYNGAYAIIDSYSKSTPIYCILTGLSTIYFSIQT
jgi:hypothetical protein